LVWSTTDNVSWVVEVPGVGWSSPIVLGSRIFLTSALGPERSSENFSGLGEGDDIPPEDLIRPEDFSEPVRYMLYCLDVETGRTLWEREVHRGVPPAPSHVKNSLASETPATDGERVYAYFGDVGLFAYGLDGELQWKQAMSAQALYEVGSGSSPVVADGQVYVLRDQDGESYLIAFDARTGEERWRKRRARGHSETGAGWMTPLYWKSSKRVELVTSRPGVVASYGTDGTELWTIDTGIRDIAASPVAAGDLAYIPIGSPADNDRPLFAIRAGAAGKVSPQPVDDGVVRWRQRVGAPYLPSPVVYRNNVFIVRDEGILMVYDARTGVRKHRSRIGDGTGFTSSPWASRGRVYFLGEEGDTFVIESGDDFELLSKNSLDSHTQASAALAHDSVFIRTAKKLFRITER